MAMNLNIFESEKKLDEMDSDESKGEQNNNDDEGNSSIDGEDDDNNENDDLEYSERCM